MRFDSNVSLRIRDAYHARHEPEAERYLGSIFWAFLVIVFSLIVVASLAFGAWEFLKPTASLPESVTAGARKQFTRAELLKLLEAFDSREKTYESRLTEPIPVKDPS